MKKIVIVASGIGTGGVTSVCKEVSITLNKLYPQQPTTLLVTFQNNHFQKLNLPFVHELSVPQEEPTLLPKRFHDWILTEKPDLLLFNDIPVLEQYWPYIPSKVKVIVGLHDIAYGWRKGIINNIHSIDGIIAVSPFVRKILMKDISEHERKIFLVENGSEYPDAPTRRFLKGSLKLIFLGALVPHKGIFDLPKILKKLNFEFELKIVGGVHEKLKQLFERNGLEKSINWMGRLTREQCFCELASADILIMPSRSEPFGMVTIEAMGMGCVPVGYNVGGTGGIIIDGQNGLHVKPFSIRDFAKKIGELNSNREFLLRLSNEGIRHARTRYSSEKMASDYMEVFQKILKSEERVERKDFYLFNPKPLNYRRYARYIPPSARGLISNIIVRFPKLENYFRKWRGV